MSPPFSIATLSYKQFPTGTILQPILTFPTYKGSPPISPPPVPPELTIGTDKYEFEFWNSPAGITKNPTLQFTPPDPALVPAYDVTAWYAKKVGGISAEVYTWAFSINKDEAIGGQNAATHIASVTPASQWAQATSTISTIPSPVTIAAPNLIKGYGLFNSWMDFGMNGSVSGAALTVPATEDGDWAIAFYAIPQPDPCADIAAQLNNLSPGDFNSEHAYAKARAYLLHQLKLCRGQYGE